MTSAPQQPDIIPLKEVEKHAILAAVKRLGVQGAAIALGVGKTTISSETTGMATRPPRVGIGMADCSNNKTEYITQRGSKGNRISQMVSGYDGTASRRAVGCSDSGASGRGEEQDGTKAPKPIKTRIRNFLKISTRLLLRLKHPSVNTEQPRNPCWMWGLFCARKFSLLYSSDCRTGGFEAVARFLYTSTFLVQSGLENFSFDSALAGCGKRVP